MTLVLTVASSVRKPSHDRREEGGGDKDHEGGVENESVGPGQYWSAEGCPGGEALGKEGKVKGR